MMTVSVGVDTGHQVETSSSSYLFYPSLNDVILKGSTVLYPRPMADAGRTLTRTLLEGPNVLVSSIVRLSFGGRLVRRAGHQSSLVVRLQLTNLFIHLVGGRFFFCEVPAP